MRMLLATMLLGGGLFLGGCETRAQEGALLGGGLGAGLGAIGGAVIGHNTTGDTGTGAAIGAGVGALGGAAAGYAIGDDQDRKDRRRYDPYHNDRRYAPPPRYEPRYDPRYDPRYAPPPPPPPVVYDRY